MGRAEWAVVSAIALFLVAVVGFAVYAVVTDDFEENCKAAGGHVVTKTSTGVGISSSGKPVVVTTTDSSCLSADGRILEV